MGGTWYGGTALRLASLSVTSGTEWAPDRLRTERTGRAVRDRSKDLTGLLGVPVWMTRARRRPAKGG